MQTTHPPSSDDVLIVCSHEETGWIQTCCHREQNQERSLPWDREEVWGDDGCCLDKVPNCLPMLQNSSSDDGDSNAQTCWNTATDPSPHD